MPNLPTINGSAFIVWLGSIGFSVIRQRGSHVRLRHEDGRRVTVPVHKSKELPKGLLRKIIREDLEMTLADFLVLWEKP